MQGGWARPLHLPARCRSAQTPADPDADLRAWLRAYATKHPCHGFRRAWAALRLRRAPCRSTRRRSTGCGARRACSVRVHSPRKRAGVSSIPQVSADAPEGGVGDRFPVRLHHRRQGHQDRVDDRRTHPRIAAASGGALDHRRAPRRPSSRRCSPPPAARRRCCGWTTVRSWFLKRCNGSARARSGCPTSRRARRGTTATSNRSTTDCARSASTATTGTPCSRPEWSIGDFKHEHNHRHRHSALGYRTPAEYAARCSHTHYPVACEIN